MIRSVVRVGIHMIQHRSKMKNIIYPSRKKMRVNTIEILIISGCYLQFSDGERKTAGKRRREND